MLKKLMRKLKSKLGESLIESLAAILIFTLSSIALLSMLSTSADINGAAKEMDAKFQQQMVAAEQASTTPDKGTVTFTIKKANNTTVDVTENVDIYSSGDGTLYSYFKQGGNGS